MDATRSSRVWLIAVIALAAGLLAAWSAHEYLHERAAMLQAQAQADIQAHTQTPTVARLVAARDLPAGTRLHADHVAIRDMPADYVASDTLAPEQFGAIDSAVLSQPLRRGDPIVAAHLHRPVTPFSARLAAGRRAVTIPVDELNAVSGMLAPGDAIDLYVSFDQRGRLLTAPLLQGVRVLATGRRALGEGVRAEEQAGEHAGNAERHRYTAITLDVAADEVAKLVLARQTGRITAMLRHPEDGQILRVAAHDDLAALLGVVRAASPRSENNLPRHSETPALLPPAQPVLVPPPPVATPPIPVIYGDQPLRGIPDLADREPAQAVNALVAAHAHAGRVGHQPHRTPMLRQEDALP